MPQIDPRVDAYLERAAPFAQPILRHLRTQVHRACPEVQETIKWGMPFFQWQGRNLVHMAGFKAHCALGLWLGDAVLRPDADYSAMGNFGRISALADLPAEAELQRLLISGRQAIEQGQVTPHASPHAPKPARRPPPTAPADLAAALASLPAAAACFTRLPPSQQREYIDWLASAKRSQTRARRLAQALDKLGAGQRLNPRPSAPTPLGAGRSP